MSRFFNIILLFLLFTNISFASDLYWVNGSGNWNDPTHWSKNSGGQGGIGIPSLKDNVFFDHNWLTKKDRSWKRLRPHTFPGKGLLLITCSPVG